MRELERERESIEKIKETLPNELIRTPAIFRRVKHLGKYLQTICIDQNCRLAKYQQSTRADSSFRPSGFLKISPFQLR